MRTTLLATLCAIGLSLALAGRAGAGTITSPIGTPQHPFQVPADGNDNPIAFTIAGSAWSLGQSVYIEQCDGVPPTARGWDPTTDCDTGTAPAAALGDAHGNVSFPATSHNYAFPVFRGASPQGLFNCLSPHQPEPNNGLPSFRTCQVRMSSSNANATADQAFISIVLPDSSHGYAATSQASPPGVGAVGSNGAGTNSGGSNGAGSNASGSDTGGSVSAAAHSGSGSSGGWLASTGAKILLGVLIGVILIVAGLLLVRRRHERQPA